MSDDSLRRAHRDWLSVGTPDEHHRYVRERQLMGLYGHPAPELEAARALLAAWPRYKGGRKRGRPKPAAKLTYSQADELIRAFYEAAGWIPKLGEEDPIPPTHERAGWALMPKGFPPERDPEWNPIQWGALISPDFSTWLGSLGVRTAIFYEWIDDVAPGRSPYWSSHDVPRWELEEGDWSSSVDKKILAGRLLDAALRVEDPYHPNPGCSYDKVVFSDSRRSGKKRQAYFTGDSRNRTVHFGATGYEDYTMHQDPERRRRYLERHGRGREDWDRCDTPGSLSRWVLWGDSTSRSENERAFRKRFKLKNPARGSRHPRLSRTQWDELISALVNNRMTPAEAAQHYGINRSTISAQLKKRPYAHRVVKRLARDRARVAARRNAPPGLRIKIIDKGFDGFLVRAYLKRRLVGGVNVVQKLKFYDVSTAKVDEDQRRLGIGTALYEAAHAEACRRGKPLRSQGYQRSPMATRVWRQLPRAVPLPVEGRHMDFMVPCPNPPQLLARLEALRPQLAAAANQAIAEFEWEYGGACDAVAQELGGVLGEAGIDTLEGGHPGDDHAWLIAYDEKSGEAAGVDIPPSVYETGGGYAWEQILGAQVAPHDVALWSIPFEDIRESLE